MSLKQVLENYFNLYKQSILLSLLISLLYFILLYFVDSCLALRCEHMCVNIQSGPKCVCSEGFQLNEDATTCTGMRWFLFKINKKPKYISILNLFETILNMFKIKPFKYEFLDGVQ